MKRMVMQLHYLIKLPVYLDIFYELYTVNSIYKYRFIHEYSAYDRGCSS